MNGDELKSAVRLCPDLMNESQDFMVDWYRGAGRAWAMRLGEWLFATLDGTAVLLVAYALWYVATPVR